MIELFEIAVNTDHGRFTGTDMTVGGTFLH
jgi:hypothetical protein